MEHRSADELRAFAEISANPPPSMDRKARLERWADLLDQEPDRRINLVIELEFAMRAAQVEMRADNSALTVAYADPLFRALGLRSDRVGDGQKFFGLGEGDAHRLLCSCMHGMSMRAGDAARLIRTIANPMPRVAARAALSLAICSVPAALYFFG